MYLAGLLDGRGQTSDALPHYRMYLELAATTASDVRPAPDEVVLVLVRFADALARQSERDAALTQYDLAIRIARQTGLSDLEALALERRAALGPR